METFYDGDLRDIWDSDLDPTESLHISTDHDMHDWFLERDVKDPAVILNDKLISDALLVTQPIKSEHSYSLNSDGDSLPDSPRSLQVKMDDIDDECYPVISMKTVAGNMRNASVDPKCLTLHPPSTLNCSSVTNSANLGNTRTTNTLLSNGVSSLTTTTKNYLCSIEKIANGNLEINMCSVQQNSDVRTSGTFELPTQQYLPQKLAAMFDNDCSSSTSTREGSISPDICSDIEIDESCIKDEPLSPHSSCPASPKLQNCDLNATGSFNLKTNASQRDLFFEHKNGCLQLTPTSQNMIKSESLLSNNQKLNLPKISIKNEKQIAYNTATTTSSTKNINSTYGIPLTPPSSLPSDESVGNLTPEHLFSPLSPNTSTSFGGGTIPGTITTIEPNGRRNNSCLPAGANGRTASTTSTRQPIHTPLISSQPKGSTGTLLLTEEEKRTLLAEGYPIPQRLPLTKAEEKSLKKIRRKIKNKISAQESRRKKKEYMDQLERRVEILVNENSDYKKRVDLLEDTNTNLLHQLHKLQTLINKQNIKKV